MNKFVSFDIHLKEQVEQTQRLSPFMFWGVEPFFSQSYGKGGEYGRWEGYRGPLQINFKGTTKWKSKTWVTSFELLVQIYDLRVKI